MLGLVYQIHCLIYYCNVTIALYALYVRHCFKIRIQALKIQIQALKIRIQALKVRIQAFKIRIQAFKIRIQAFKIRIQAFKIRIQASNCARKYFVRRYNFAHRLYINSLAFDAKIKLIKSSLQPDPCVRIFAREIFVQAYKGLID